MLGRIGRRLQSFRAWLRKRAEPRWRAWLIDEIRRGYSAGDLWIPWNEIFEISAYKRDRWTTDQIVVAITYGPEDRDGNRRWIPIVEDDPSYPAILEDLETRYPLREAWWREVAFPAFERNYTALWRREQPGS